MIRAFILFALVLALPVSVGAQASLQGAGGSLQPQAGQTQNTRSLQNQTVPLQTNNPGATLNSSRPGALGVVSSPDQTEPDVVAQADPDLKTDITNSGGGSPWRTIFAILLVVYAAVVTYRLFVNSYAAKPGATVAATIEEPVVKTKPKKKKLAAKDGKKRKSKRRY